MIYNYIKFKMNASALRANEISELKRLGVVRMPRVFVGTSDPEMSSIYGLVLSDDAENMKAELFDHISDKKNEALELVTKERVDELTKQYKELDLNQNTEELNI